MRRRILSFVVAAALVPASVPLPAQAQNPGQVARNACASAITREVRHRFPQAARVQFLGARMRQASNAENAVTGQGQFESRSGWSKFSYHCTYNIRNGSTYGLSVKAASGGGGGRSGDSDMTAGQAVGVILGAAIAGAIVNSVSKDSGGGGQREWWSPGQGVQCNSHMSRCYVNRRFAPGWTQKIYGR